MNQPIISRSIIKVQINGKSLEAEKGEYLLSLARRAGIIIPTFCHHDALSGLGSCRLCVVEVDEGSGRKVVVSCVYPLGRDCEIWTESDRIQRIRRMVLSMLRGRAPDSEIVASWCETYGVPPEDRYSPPSPGGRVQENGLAGGKCVLCGLCAEACATLGAGAISTLGRGVGKRVSTPYDEPSGDCIGCGSCAEVCPTGAIDCREEGGVRTIWGKRFELLRCAGCGRPFATKEEFARVNGAAADPPLCEACRKEQTAGVLAGAFGV